MGSSMSGQVAFSENSLASLGPSRVFNNFLGSFGAGGGCKRSEPGPHVAHFHQLGWLGRRSYYFVLFWLGAEMASFRISSLRGALMEKPERRNVGVLKRGFRRSSLAGGRDKSGKRVAVKGKRLAITAQLHWICPGSSFSRRAASSHMEPEI
jgi:hypothetical protein